MAQRGIPEPPGSEDASFGQRIHAALAYSAEKNTGINPGVLPLEDREVFDACRDIEKKTVSRFFDGNKSPMRVFRHERYWARFQTADGLVVQHSGEADVVFRAGAQALIADYKTLPGDVAESPRNMQLRDLVVMVRGNYVTIEEVGAVIIQPFVTHSPEIVLYTIEDIQKAEQALAARVVASNDPKSQRVAGEVQCKFCLAKPHCDVYQRWASQLAPPAMLSVLEVPMANWTPEQRAIAQGCISRARKLCDEIEAFNKSGLSKDPGFLPGWRLKPGAVREAINNPQAVFERFSALGGKVEQFMKTLVVRKSSLREAMNTLTGAKGMALDKAIDTLTDGLVTSKQAAASLEKVEEEGK